MKRFIILSGAVVVAAALTAVAFADDNGSGFQTSRPSMLAPVKAGVTVTPLLTVGDTLKSGYRFEAIPDGISVANAGPRAGRPVRQPRDREGAVPVRHGRADRGQRRERLRQRPGQPADPRPALGRRAERLVRHRQQRRLPAVLLELPRDVEARASTRDILFTNEETPDYVYRQEASWPPPIGSPDRARGRRRRRARRPERQAPPDLRHGPPQPRERRRDPGLSTSRSCSRATTRSRAARSPASSRPGAVPAQSQLYSYIARSARGAAGRQGRPVGVRLRHARREELLRRRPRIGDGRQGPLHQGAEGHRHRPQRRRLGAQGRRQGLPARRRPTAAGRRDLRSATPLGIDGPQWVLEYWSDINNVFQFVRVEDIAYDKRPGMRTSSTSSTRAAAGPPPRASTRQLPVDERPRLEDGARPQGPDEGDVADGVRRG